MKLLCLSMGFAQAISLHTGACDGACGPGHAEHDTLLDAAADTATAVYLSTCCPSDRGCTHLDC